MGSCRLVSESTGGTPAPSHDLLALFKRKSTPKLTVGVDSGCDIVLPSDTPARLSRKHVRLTFSDLGELSILDTSAWGTWVNGSRLHKRVHRILEDGDVVTFGSLGTVRNPRLPVIS